ncbi:unnamed protein product, partial [Brenthis ino]
MTLSEIAEDVISGEILTVDLEFRNVGPVPMQNLYVAVSHPDCMSVVSADDDKDDFNVLYEEKYREQPEYSGCPPESETPTSTGRGPSTCAVFVSRPERRQVLNL